jgi:tRNA nucleotidyltransferase/poly(A) polymerase
VGILTGVPMSRSYHNNNNNLEVLIRSQVRAVLRESTGPDGPVRMKKHIEIPGDLREISRLFSDAQKKFYLVGGAIRDVLLGRTPKDFDVATDAHPEEVVAILEASGSPYRILEVGQSFGVVRVITPDNNEYEIATFRIDIGKGRRPDAVSFSTIEQDVLRRDLTINALFYDISSEEIVDYVGGLQDLEKGVIRTVGSPEERFSEDRLRILRALRFAARVGSELDPGTSEAITRNNSLEGVSPERIRAEFISGVKSARSPGQFLQMISDHGLWSQVFPGVSVDENFTDSRDLPVVLALLLGPSKGPKESARALNRLRYEHNEVLDVAFLLEFRELAPENVLWLYRASQARKIPKKRVEEYARLAGQPDQRLVEAFFNYKPTTSGDDLVAQGFSGPRLGHELADREAAAFRALLR